MVEARHCKDCGFVVQEEELSTCMHSVDDVSNLGVSAFLFFSSYVNVIILLIEMVLVYSVFALVTNILGAVDQPE